MKQKRSLFDIIFGRRPKEQAGLTQLQLLNGYSPVFTAWHNDPYSADIVRGAVDAVARNAAKLKPKHIKRIGKEIMPAGGQTERVLQVRPNPNMSAYDFLYKMVTTLLIDNNAFAYPVWEGQTLKAIWPVNCTQAEFVEDSSKTIYIRFRFGMGKQVVLPYSEVLHLRRHFYKGDLSGESNAPINNTLEAIHTTNEGLGQAVKTSANLRGIIKYQGMLKESDIKANRDRFVSEYMSMNNDGGIAALDAKADYIELNSEPKMINAEQMKELRDNVYRYFGVNENIVMGAYDEQGWDAFYESTIEPLAVQMSLEFTSKLFTAGERGRGNEIMFEANRLAYASTKTKVAMMEKLIPMGLLTINEGREIFNLAPVEGGDKRLVSLNYVDASKQNLYQTGEGDEGGDSQKGDPDSAAEGT
ncbi:phage portal protein [Pelotomaculum propionicicum]|uniref:phage portal protein n=1 Tax=Pelotomaculum propionicicum TaxID=258475 RepID=UPI003B7AF1A8